MLVIVRRLLPAYTAEVALVFASWALFGDSEDMEDALRWALFAVSLAVLPFIAGYIVARLPGTRYLWRCAAAGASISVVSILAVTLTFSISAEPGQFLLATAGYVLSSVLLAVPLQLAFGGLGGWLYRKRNLSVGP